MSLIDDMTRGFYERKAKNESYADLQERLHRNELAVYKRMMNATDFAHNHKTSAHVIGIERWGAHRLRVLLGEPLIVDEYDGYAPSAELSMPALAEEFKQTREATIALVSELQSKGVALTETVLQNDLGDMSLRAWIFYIENHTGRETLTMLQRLTDRVVVSAIP
jgi:hypothetical protein